jgi:hypothetical protein
MQDYFRGFFIPSERREDQKNYLVKAIQLKYSEFKEYDSLRVSKNKRKRKVGQY